LTALTPYFVSDKSSDDDTFADTFVPNEIARGGWGPTLGGHVVGGLLARCVEEKRADAGLVPARFTVDILRRVAAEPVRVEPNVVRLGRRMQAIDATMTQHGEVVARASTLFLRRSEQPAVLPWTTDIGMPPIPAEPSQYDGSAPIFIAAFGGDASQGGNPWQYESPRYAWVRHIRGLVDDEEPTPFLCAAMAVDVTASLTGFSTEGLGFINADYTLTLCRLPEGPFIGLAALTHYSDGGIATGTASLFDARGPIGTGRPRRRPTHTSSAQAGSGSRPTPTIMPKPRAQTRPDAEKVAMLGRMVTGIRMLEVMLDLTADCEPPALYATTRS
jgi:acyl-coenzyme A thioesterase PaaI-like protein